MSLTPYDPTRGAVHGDNEIPEELIAESAVSKPLLHLFRKGVVVEVLGDPSTRDDEFFKQFEVEQDPADEDKEYKNAEELRIAPRNSLIVRDITSGKGRDDNRNIVCFPFFSSHMMLPVKPGETVWFLYITLEESNNRSYWMTRVHDLDFVEDANFTHHDRRHDDTVPDSDADERTPPSLHNGGDPNKIDPKADDPDGESQHQTFEDSEAFAKIRSDSLESKRFVVEPVPRITKRPGDLVIQGSNNTAIVLGTDYGFGLIDRPAAKPEEKKSLLTAEQPPPLFQGSIDVVAGRGRIYGTDTLDALASESSPPAQTRARVVQNAEGDFETDKNTANDKEQGGDEEKESRVNLEADPNEGDPDFIHDASRIYVSMQTDVDANFGTVLENIPEAYDNDAEKSTLQDVAAAAAIALKSDEIRIIARKTKDQVTTIKDTEYEDVADINGSIRIIKEGDPKTDAACIYLLPDGTIQITGSKIMIGRGTVRDEGTALDPAKNEKGDDVGFVEPYMRYTEFTEWATGLIDAINEAFVASQDAINANGSAIDGCGNAGASGGAGGALPAPNGPLGAALAQLIAPAGASFAHAPDPIDAFKDTTPIKSKRIFGE